MTNNKKEIEDLQDVKCFVDKFYAKVREDILLKDIFNNIIQDRWPQHLDKMYSFWQTVLLEEHTYNGSPFPPHAKMPVNAQHFDQWIILFNATIDELFWGEKADQAKWQGQRMAEMFLAKIQYFQNQNLNLIL